MYSRKYQQQKKKNAYCWHAVESSFLLSLPDSVLMCASTCEMNTGGGRWQSCKEVNWKSLVESYID